MKRLALLGASIGSLLLSASAFAQDPAHGGTSPAGTASSGTTPTTVTPASGTAPGDQVTKVSGVESKDVATGGFEDPNTPFEKANTTYRFIGARFRYVLVPKFYMNLFGDGGTTVGVPAFGPEFTIRKNQFEYVLSAMYANYNMGANPFKAKSDPDVAYEVVKANINALYLMSDFLWSSEVSPKFAFQYGAGFGIAAVFGDIHRQQSYPGPGAGNDPYKYLPCTAQGVPNAQYCGTDNTHYGNYTEPSWANSGSKPIVFPWLALQTGFRWKPARQFMMRFDLGWNLLNGPFAGIGLNYGL